MTIRNLADYYRDVKEQKKHHLLSIFLIAVFSITVYSNTLKNGFVYDDDDIVVNVTLIRDLNNLPKLIDKDYFVISGEASYRPVVTFTYFLDYVLYKLNPWGYHLTNILLHAGNGVLLYIFLILLLESGEKNKKTKIIPMLSSLPLAISLLFAIHPVLTEAVNAISFREDLLAFLFYMATLTLYLHLRLSTYSSPSIYLFYLISGLLYFLALLSKEMAVTLPLVIYCYELVYSNPKNLVSRPIVLNLYNLGYIAITFAYLYLRFVYFQNPYESAPVSWDITERFLTIPWLLLNYIKLTVFPISLSADYDIIPIRNLISLSFIVPSLIVVFLLAAAFKMKEKEKAIAFGIFFFIVTFIPICNLIPINNPFAERYLYLPSVGLITVAGSIIYKVCNAPSIILLRVRFVHLLIPLLMFIIYSVATVARNGAWHDSCDLWFDTLRKMPNSSRAHNGVGFCYYRQGQFDKAIQEFQAALKLNPYNSDAYNNLGSLYADKGMVDEAISLFKAALEQKQSPMLHYNLGNVYADSGKLEESIFHFLSAIRINPYDPNTHYNLANTYYKTEQFDESIKEYKAALRLNPNFVGAHFNLGTAYIKQGLKDEARTEFETVLMLNPNFVPARQALEFIK